MNGLHPIKPSGVQCFPSYNYGNLRSVGITIECRLTITAGQLKRYRKFLESWSSLLPFGTWTDPILDQRKPRFSECYNILRPQGKFRISNESKITRQASRTRT